MKMLLARVGWGSTYDSDQPVVGGGNENTGSERFNFQPLEGICYGFFPVGNGWNHLNLKRIDPGSVEDTRVDGVLVVWVATNPADRGQFVVGWYQNAVVFNSVLKRPDGPGHYRVYADVENCTLVREGHRELKLPPDIIDGQSSLRYYPQTPNAVLEAEFERIRKYINTWTSSNTRLGSGPSKSLAEVEAEAELERQQGFQSNSVIRHAIEKHAEERVITLFREHGVDLERHPKPQWPWDFKYVKDGRTVFIEVKGTQGDGEAVILTAGEVQFAQRHPDHIELYVIRHIKVGPGDPLSVSGGEIVKRCPWYPGEHDLTPTQYRCKFKAGGPDIGL